MVLSPLVVAKRLVILLRPKRAVCLLACVPSALRSVLAASRLASPLAVLSLLVVLSPLVSRLWC